MFNIVANRAFCLAFSFRHLIFIHKTSNTIYTTTIKCMEVLYGDYVWIAGKTTE